MGLWSLLCACTGAPVEELRSTPIKPTTDLSSSALVIPGDSPLAPLVPRGQPAWPTGALGRLVPGLPLEEVRRLAIEIRHPARPPDDRTPAPGLVAISGQLVGFEHLGFVAACQDGKLVSLDVAARNRDWDGVLEAAWGPGVLGTLQNGIPTSTWTNDEAGLRVTQVRNDDGLMVVKWETLPPR